MVHTNLARLHRSKANLRAARPVPSERYAIPDFDTPLLATAAAAGGGGGGSGGPPGGGRTVGGAAPRVIHVSRAPSLVEGLPR